MRSPVETVYSVIGRVRQKKRLLAFMRGSGDLLLAVAASLFVISILFFFSAESYGSVGPEGALVYGFALLKIIFLGLMLYILVWKVLLPLLFPPNFDEVALRVEEEAGGLGNVFINALQLHRAIKSPSLRNIFSSSLAGAHFREAEGVAKNLSYALPRNDIKRAVATFCMALFIILLWPKGIYQAASYLFIPSLFPQNAFGKNSLGNIRTLEIGDIEVKYNYPAYTGWPPREVKGSDGSLEALKGTQALIKARTVGSFDRADIVFEGVSIPMNLGEKSTLEGTVNLLKEGDYHIVAFKGEGIYEEDMAHPISIKHDEHPRIEMLSPKENIELAEAGTLEVSFEASDDFGVKQIDIVYSSSRGQGRKLSLIHI